MKLSVLLLCLMFVTTGCPSSSIMSAGGYRQVNMNDPACMGLSASTVILDRGSPETMVKAHTTTKSGYCENLTEQVIQSTGIAAGQYLRGKGAGRARSKFSTNSNDVTNITNPSVPAIDDCEEPGRC